MENQTPPLTTLLIRYLGIGFIATGVHYAVFLLLVTTEFVTPLLASICGGMVGAIASFVEIGRSVLWQMALVSFSLSGLHWSR